MEKLIANLSSKVVKKTLQGRDYLVAPVAMLVEGVFSGSQGPIFYDSVEIAKSVAVWNARPITIGHPELPDGTKVSGCTAENLENYQCGMILNTRFNKKTKKLVAEAWFDVARLPIIPQGIIIANALVAETKLEVSTGLFVDSDKTTGSYNGKEYNAKATNFRPDHLAIILNGVGACSLADGAGLLVNKNTIPPNTLQIGSKWESGELLDILEKQVVFATNDENSSLYRQNYAMENESVKLLGNLIPVTRKVTYEPIVSNQNEKVNMDRTSLATALGEAHKDFVANLTDEQVAAIAAVKAPEVKPDPVPVANSLDEVVAAAPSHLQSQLQDALVANKRLRDSYVTVIVANKANAFSDVELGAMSTASLEKLATLATVVTAAPAKTQPLFAGSPVTNAAPAEEKPFTAPSTL